MSGKRVLAVYAALLLGFAVVLCRLYLLAQHPAYAARAAAQSTVTLQLPARRGNFYDAQGRLLTGLEERWQVVCFPGQGNYDRLYACTDAAGQALLYRSRSRAAPFLLEVSCDPARLGLTGYSAARRYAAVPLCQHLLGYLDGTDHGAAGLEKALDAVLSGTGENSSLVCAVTAQGTLRIGETARLLQADSGALGVQLTISRPVQRAVEAVAASTMTSGCILVLDTATAAVRASVSVPCYDPEHLADSLQAENSPFLNRALQSYAVGSVFKPVLAAAALEAGLQPVFECTGAVVVDGQIFRCAGGVPHGQVDLAAALEKSCNGYFIRLGQQLGAESLLDAAKDFGFGHSLPLAEELAAEAGQLPTAQELAQSGQLANFSFGQGSLLAAPMQVAALFNTIAADGVYRSPYVLQATLDEATGQPVETLGHPRGRRVIPAQSAALLRTMLVQVVQQGTAQDAAGLSGGAGGKTGTAQTGQLPAPQELVQSGQLANFSFGQGSLLATPMQVAALFNTLAADGVYRAPYVLQATLDETTGQPVEPLSHPRGRRVLPAQSAALLRTMLVQVVQQGTAQDAAGVSGGAGGKTGTAQTGQFTPEGAERCNLWFAGFWPAEKPRYTIVVLQDGAIHTAYSGAAIFAQVCSALEAAG